MRILCNHNVYTLLLCFHRAHASVLYKCSTSQIMSLSFGYTAGSIISQNLAFSTSQLVLHQPIFLEGNTRIILSIFLSSYKKVHKCICSFDGVFGKSARELLAFAYPHMAHFLYLAFFDVAPAVWVLSSPSPLASSFVNG